MNGLLRTNAGALRFGSDKTVGLMLIENPGLRIVVPLLIEGILNQELGEPFRRDAMKPPVEVAGIDPNDMRPQ